MLTGNIEEFLKSSAIGVIGASSNREKAGNKVVLLLKENRYEVHPVHPKEKIIEGLAVVQSVSELPEGVHSISIITPPTATEQVVDEAIKKGIKNIWIQPGAENDAAIRKCISNNINLISKGPCLIKELQSQKESVIVVSKKNDVDAVTPKVGSQSTGAMDKQDYIYDFFNQKQYTSGRSQTEGAQQSSIPPISPG